MSQFDRQVSSAKPREAVSRKPKLKQSNVRALSSSLVQRAPAVLSNKRVFTSVIMFFVNFRSRFFFWCTWNGLLTMVYVSSMFYNNTCVVFTSFSVIFKCVFRCSQDETHDDMANKKPPINLDDDHTQGIESSMYVFLLVQYIWISGCLWIFIAMSVGRVCMYMICIARISTLFNVQNADVSPAMSAIHANCQIGRFCGYFVVI